MATTRSTFSPVVISLRNDLTVELAAQQLSSLPHLAVLQSATWWGDGAGVHHRRENTGDRTLDRYSYVLADPFEWFTIEPNELSRLPTAGAIEQIRQRMKHFKADAIEELPPFQGGAVVLLSYSLAQNLEAVQDSEFCDVTVPSLAVGIYDTVIAFDHLQNSVRLISQGFPKIDPVERSEFSVQRANHFSELFQISKEKAMRSRRSSTSAVEFADHSDDELNSRIKKGSTQFSVAAPEKTLTGKFTSNFSQESYHSAVNRCIEYIRAGDVFQVNLAQQLLCPPAGSPLNLFQTLSRCNPAPFAAFFDLGDRQIASASPELFLRLSGDLVETRPIKGTRRRQRIPEADLPMALQLQSSEKDRSENIMIVDLMRNDLSRVCRNPSVQVKQLCEVESYHSVMHLVSSVTGRLKAKTDLYDLLVATFPGGSITGAPKVRAMEIIAELEPSQRGAYCGSLGYISFTGDATFNILIRTITCSPDVWQIPVGGGIVAASDPDQEYAETWHKAHRLLFAIEKMRDSPSIHLSSQGKGGISEDASAERNAHGERIGHIGQETLNSSSGRDRRGSGSAEQPAPNSSLSHDTSTGLRSRAKSPNRSRQRVLLIDNYDSFVHNLARYLRLHRCFTDIVRNDQVTLEQIESSQPDVIVLSPGPKTPAESGVCLDLIKTFAGKVPILGICLGHQAIVCAYGGALKRAGKPIHGQGSLIRHDGSHWYEGVSNPFQVGRYHSLIAEETSLPSELVVNARTEHGTIMGVHHQTDLVVGFQFHPESLLTEFGPELLKNFLDAVGNV